MKKELRDNMLNKRKNLPLEIVKEKSLEIKSRLFDIPQFIIAKGLLFYVSFRNEVDTIPMMEECLCTDKKVYVPVVVKNSKNLVISQLQSFDELCTGNYGILEPMNQYIRPVCIDEIEVVIVPGAAFDEEGFRLGYGGGYYDRLYEKLPDKCLTIGLGFEMQIVDKVPRESHDMKLDMIVTEKRIIMV